MSQGFPITLRAELNLLEKGIHVDSLSAGKINMESDHYISVKDKHPEGEAQMVIIDLHNNCSVDRRPLKAEAALMHPDQEYIVLKAKQDGDKYLVQVYDLASKVRLVSHQLHEDIILWRWASKTLLALVTVKSIYHLSIQGSNPPEKIFDRAEKLADTEVQLINYAMDAPGSWCALVGLYKEPQDAYVQGAIQLYSVSKKQNYMLEGHAFGFGEFLIDSSKTLMVFAYAERKRGNQNSTLHILDFYSPRTEEGPAPFKVSCEIEQPSEHASDFPLALHISKKYGVVYLITKAGFLAIFDCLTATMLFRHRISQDSLFVSTIDHRNGGVLAINRQGVVLSATVSESTFIGYIQSQLTHTNREQIAVSFATRYGLPGADKMLISSFNQSFAKGDYEAAATIVANMKSGALRTAQTIEQFKAIKPTAPGAPSPAMTYFSILLKAGKLNALESKELVTAVVRQGRSDMIDAWIQASKLECTDEVGDIIKPLDVKLALAVYVMAGSHTRVVQCLAEQGHYDHIVAYCLKVDHKADFLSILRSMVGVSRETTIGYCKKLLEPEVALVDIEQMVEILAQQGKLQELTSILLDYMKKDLPEQGNLQTRLLEINLLHSPQAAETIFQIERYTHFDRKKIAPMCERAGLHSRALELYTDVADIKRVMIHVGGTLSDNWLQQYFSKLSPEAGLEILADMLRNNRGNLQAVVSQSIKFHEKLGTQELIKMFESFSMYEGIFYFLGAILPFSQDSEVHFKYIEAAVKLNHMQEVERCCRESKYYEPERLKNFLMSLRLSDPRPLIRVCDLHNYLEEMTEFLYNENMTKYIEVYVLQVNPQKAPVVLSTLVNLHAPEEFIKGILQMLRGMCPVGLLVEEMENKHRLGILVEWLEARAAEGNQEAALHNSLAKIYIDENRSPEEFLSTNQFYDSMVIGNFCEERDPHLAFAAYRRAKGECDVQLINVTNKNNLFRLQARYLVERQSPELWAMVLSSTNEHRSMVVDQVVSTALPESTSSDEVSVAVKAFIDANLPSELIELLEKIVLHNSDFSENENLQNLLILTAVRADRSRVKDYINRLDNYEGAKIAAVALDNGLHEEAYQIYRKFNMNVEAINTLLLDAENLDRASEFASRLNDPEIWSKLAGAQLQMGSPSEAVSCYMKASDSSNFSEVIAKCKEAKVYSDLCSYLKMARSLKREALIDTEYLYALAQCDMLSELEDLISSKSTHLANTQKVGDELFEEGRYEAAKRLFLSIPNYAKLARCYVKMKDFRRAVEAAGWANNPKTWKDVCYICIAAREVECARKCSAALIIHPDHLEEVIDKYEEQCLFKEIVEILEEGIYREKTHVGMFTSLAVLYSKYDSSKLMDLCVKYSGKFNIPKVCRACEKAQLWKECVYLHSEYNEYDQAVTLMMNHPSAYEHQSFIRYMTKASNVELFYKSIEFYFNFHPLLLGEYIKAIAKFVDHTRVIQMARRGGYLALIEPYIVEVQSLGVSSLVEAYNELLVESSNYEGLKRSIEQNSNINHGKLAKELRSHPHPEFRRLACLLMRKSSDFSMSIEASLKDEQHLDAMEAAADSKNPALVLDLIKHFANNDQANCFCACLVVCYLYLKAEDVLEIAWKKGWNDLAMPFLLQTMHDQQKRLSQLEKREEERMAKEKKDSGGSSEYVTGMVMTPNLLSGMNNLALMPPPPTSMNDGKALGLGSISMGGMQGSSMGMGVGGMPLSGGLIMGPSVPSGNMSAHSNGISYPPMF